jgi:putative hydrolase of the HAD superfamily
MPTNIVFDFGAVLFTWRPQLLVQQVFPLQAATAAAARELSAAIFHHRDWQEFDRGTMQLASVVTSTAQRLGLPHVAVQTLMSGIAEHLAPIPQTVALLERLRQRRAAADDVRLYFLSNMPEPYARVLEQRHAFLGWFDGGLFSGDVRLVKPEPEIFQTLQTRYALEPQQTLFIDDLPANVEAARAHGWHGIHFESAEQLEPQLQAHLP